LYEKFIAHWVVQLAMHLIEFLSLFREYNIYPLIIHLAKPSKSNKQQHKNPNTICQQPTQEKETSVVEQSFAERTNEQTNERKEREEREREGKNSFFLCPIETTQHGNHRRLIQTIATFLITNQI
jgi:hypothetical protein